jgi:hypothetical protein
MTSSSFFSHKKNVRAHKNGMHVEVGILFFQTTCFSTLYKSNCKYIFKNEQVFMFEV